MKPNSPFTAKYLGLTEYEKAAEHMIALRDQRLKGEIQDHLLFLEHPPVITMGRQSSQDDLKISQQELKKKGIRFIKTDRGGRLTYHGPGQLVVYFICNIQERGLSVDKWVWCAEEGLRLLLEKYGIDAVRDSRNPGLWIDNRKIASLGFHIHKGVTTHGISLNVSPDLEPFSYMIPCGVHDTGTTSIFLESGQKLSIMEISNQLSACYARIFTPTKPISFFSTNQK